MGLGIILPQGDYVPGDFTSESNLAALKAN